MTTKTVFPNPEFVTEHDVQWCLQHQVLPLYENDDHIALAHCQPVSFPHEKEKVFMPISYEELVHHFSEYISENRSVFLSELISSATNQLVSDIHIYSREHTYDVYFRIHGELSLHKVLPKQNHSWILSQIKLLSDCDISITHQPQDGRLTINNAHARVSTLPTVFGEDCVIRLIASRESEDNLESLGFEGEKI